MPRAIEQIRTLAKSVDKHIVLPEADDPRVLQAAGEIVKQSLGRVSLVGDAEQIERQAGEIKADLTGVTLVDPSKDDRFSKYADLFYQLRKNKGVTQEQARTILQDPVYYGVMLVKQGAADGLVSGAAHSTADTVRPALQILKTAPGISIVSSFFLMIVPDCEFGAAGNFVFADCGLVIDPSAQELAEIAIVSAASARVLMGVEPYVAMLSFSTKGSARHPMADKVIEATRIAQQRAPHLAIDGELQGDAAMVKWIGEKKAPGSSVAGRANVLIFPDLGSGNIAYKLTQRLAKAEAYGPILQGVARPVNDLSRGCSVEDIVNVAAITAAQTVGQIEIPPAPDS